MKCQWKTVALTAKSPEDFIGTTGAVEFASGARNSTINITIIDNNISELEKTFRVELFNAEGGGTLSKSISLQIYGVSSMSWPLGQWESRTDATP